MAERSKRNCNGDVAFSEQKPKVNLRDNNAFSTLALSARRGGRNEMEEIGVSTCAQDSRWAEVYESLGLGSNSSVLPVQSIKSSYY